MLDPEAVEALVEETAEKYRRYLNPSLSNLLKFMGFGTVPEFSRGVTLTDVAGEEWLDFLGDRKSTRLNSSHTVISYAVFCLKKKKKNNNNNQDIDKILA